MGIGSLTVIGVFGALWAVVQFWLKNHFEMLKSRRESGIEFLTKINKCSAQLEHGIESNHDCVCFDSYSAFAINLSFKQANTLRGCWEDYLYCRSQESPDKKEMLNCLLCLEYNVQENTEPFSLIEKAKHLFHKLQLKVDGAIGTTDCSECTYNQEGSDNENLLDKN